MDVEMEMSEGEEEPMEEAPEEEEMMMPAQAPLRPDQVVIRKDYNPKGMCVRWGRRIFLFFFSLFL